MCNVFVCIYVQVIMYVHLYACIADIQCNFYLVHVIGIASALDRALSCHSYTIDNPVLDSNGEFCMCVLCSVMFASLINITCLAHEQNLHIKWGVWG